MTGYGRKALLAFTIGPIVAFLTALTLLVVFRVIAAAIGFVVGLLPVWAWGFIIAWLGIGLVCWYVLLEHEDMK